MELLAIKENNGLLTTGVYDEAIFKWKIIIEDEIN